MVASESAYLFPDGSSIIVSAEGEIRARPQGGLAYDKLRGEILRGTGRFEAIKGSAIATGVALSPMSEETRSDAYFDIVLTYTLPGK